MNSNYSRIVEHLSEYRKKFNLTQKLDGNKAGSQTEPL